MICELRGGIQIKILAEMVIALSVYININCIFSCLLHLSDSGKVFSTGWNAYGQLGLGHLKAVDEFTPVEHLSHKCTYINAGQWNSLFVCLIV